MEAAEEEEEEEAAVVVVAMDRNRACDKARILDTNDIFGGKGERGERVKRSERYGDGKGKEDDAERPERIRGKESEGLPIEG